MDEEWAKPKVLMDLLDQTYKQALETGRIQSESSACTKKVMKIREWRESSVSLESVESAILQLGLRYIPKGLDPGPAFLFPLYDVSGTLRHAHLRLLPGNITGLDRYYRFGDKHSYLGPDWLGTDDETLDAIISAEEVLVVEGPFDLLAIRALGVTVPSLSSLTKKLGVDHWDYLKMLGVERVLAMFDNEVDGKGAKAASFLHRNEHRIEVVELTCPAKDPAKALMSPQRTAELRRCIEYAGRSVSPNAPPTLIEDEG